MDLKPGQAQIRRYTNGKAKIVGPRWVILSMLVCGLTVRLQVFFLGANLQHKGSLSLSFSRAVAFSTATGNGEHAVKQRVELTVVLQKDYINETLAISGR